MPSIALASWVIVHPLSCVRLFLTLWTATFPILPYLLEFAQTHVHWVDDAVQPSHPLSPPFSALNLLQNQGLSNESALHIRWPKYWSFSFSVSPSNEYSGLISFRIDWLTGLISLLSKRLTRVFISTTVWKHHFFITQPSLWSSSHIST